MNNQPANPILHKLVFLLIAAQFAVGTQLCQTEAQCGAQPFLSMHLGLGLLITAIYSTWLFKLKIGSRIKERLNAPKGSLSKELKTLFMQLKQRNNPGSQYPALADSTQLLGLAAVGLTAIMGLLHWFVLTKTALDTQAFYMAHKLGMALVIVFVVGHVGMAVLHKLEAQKP